MHAGNLSAQQPVFQVHQPGDGQPAFDASGPRYLRKRSTDFVLFNPEIEPSANPEVQEKEGSLEAAAVDSGIVFFYAADQLFFWVGSHSLQLDGLRRGVCRFGVGWYRCLGRHVGLTSRLARSVTN